MCDKIVNKMDIRSESKLRSLALIYPSETKRLRVLLCLTSALLLVGLMAPIITLTKFVIVNNTFSVLSGVVELLIDGQIFLFAVITSFSIVFPILKITLLFLFLRTKPLRNGQFERSLKFMHDYGKWSMLDVFVVALLVVAVKLGALASVEMRYGLYAFFCAVVLTMYITKRVAKMTERNG